MSRYGRPTHRKPRPLLAFLALVALVLGQSAALVHALKHEPAKGPAQHAQVCVECASFAPLAAPHGGAAAALFVAVVAGWVFVRSVDRSTVASGPVLAFRSRAPPR
ncbi:MAG: hypothetical protein U1F08_00125 [Steroidobacteraceae bacterium]